MSTNETTDDEAQTPQPDELWLLYRRGEQSDRSRLAVGRVIERNEQPLAWHDFHGETYKVQVCYDTYATENFKPPFTLNVVRDEDFRTRLLADAWDEDYEAALDYVLGLIGVDDAADIVDGEPSYMTGGRTGYEGLRFFILDGFSESITEYSVHHGHGASRYGRAVRGRIGDIPEHLRSSALEGELHRWDGGFELRDEAAAKIVEVYLLMGEFLDEGHEGDITRLVNEYDLEYDEYRDDEGMGQ